RRHERGARGALGNSRAARGVSRDAGPAPGGRPDRAGDRRAHGTHARLGAGEPASRDEATARPAGTERHTMSDDYLWDRSGPPDADVERLERLLGSLRSTPAVPEWPGGAGAAGGPVGRAPRA